VATGGSSTDSTRAYAFTDAGAFVFAETYGDISLLTYKPDRVEPSLLQSNAPTRAVNVPQAGSLHSMNLNLQFVSVFTTLAATGIATLYKTNACSTGFQPTDLQVEWGFSTGTAEQSLVCTANTTDIVDVNPFDRFLIVFSATGPTGASFEAHASVSLLYTSSSPI
jgi:hypothetical protein